MQISVSSLLQKLKSKMRSLAPTKQKAETSEPRAVSDMTENNMPEIDSLEEKSEDCHSVAEEDVTSVSTVDSDISELKESFGELSDITDITELPNPTRYGALRDLGLTPTEAYLATRPQKSISTLSHLKSSVPKAASAPQGVMTKYELSQARELFSDMDDNEIQRLYKRVTN